LQKKEYEHLDKLARHSCTQSDLRTTVARALNDRRAYCSLRDLQDSPYLYCSDIDSTSFIKYKFKKKYPELFSSSTRCGFDVETDVLYGTGEIIMASAVYEKESAIVGVTEMAVRKCGSPEKAFDEAFEKYLSEDLRRENVEFFVVKTSIEILIRVFAWIHAKRPDFLCIWAMDFDISKVLKACEIYNYDPADLFSDPGIPKDYRYFDYIRGSKPKTTASGVFKPKPIQDQWHTVIAPASFYVVDNMCVARQIRITSPLEKAYTLDHWLGKIDRRKLNFTEAEKYIKLKWHKFMQEFFPMQYVCYNIFDSLGMNLLDDQIKDIEFTLASASGLSHYSKFASQPKQITDEYAFFLLENRRLAIASLPSNVVEDETADDLKADLLAKEAERNQEYIAKEEEDEEEKVEGQEGEGDLFLISSGTLGLKGWILTLDPQNMVLGLMIVSEDDGLHTNIRFFVFDADSTAAYPTVTDTLNVSKTTTKREIIAVEGIDRNVFRKQNLNFILGQTNAIEYCCTMHNLPTAIQMMQMLDKKEKETITL